MIYHITQKRAWEQACREGFYHGDTLESEGFIHCSTHAQVPQTADKYFHGQTGLLLLEIDPSKLAAEVRFEGLPGGDRFPHIYGPLNLDAVSSARSFEPDPEGRFELK
jgi:uncharacterized protein (DUF952 family)